MRRGWFDNLIQKILCKTDPDLISISLRCQTVCCAPSIQGSPVVASILGAQQTFLDFGITCGFETKNSTSKAVLVAVGSFLVFVWSILYF